MKTSIAWMTAAAVIASAVLVPAYADELGDAIARAQTAVNDGKLSDAKTQLEMAVALITQKNGERLKAFLPAPPDGWAAEDGQMTAMPAAMGGVTISRNYTKDDKSLEVSVVSDSPMMAMAMSLITNPQMAIMSGAKIQNVGAQQVIISQDGQLQAAVANKYLITISGSAPGEDKLAFAALIDFAGLAAFN